MNLPFLPERQVGPVLLAKGLQVFDPSVCTLHNTASDLGTRFTAKGVFGERVIHCSCHTLHNQENAGLVARWKKPNQSLERVPCEWDAIHQDEEYTPNQRLPHSAVSHMDRKCTARD